MKQAYIRVILLLFITPITQAFSQCTCSDGSSPDSVVYNQYYDSIISTNSAIKFPKFSDTIGLLTCLRLSDTVTTVVNYNLENKLDTSEDYIFETFRRSQFTGPDGFFSSVLSPTKDYGPYTLGPYDSVGHADEVDIGPDTVFNKNTHTQYFGGSSSYYGSGNVTLNYLTTSTFTILTGSDNAIIKLKAYTRLAAQLVYYWCPFSILQTNLSAFEVSVNDNNIIINWKVNDPHPTGKYEIEIGKDGKNFTDLGMGISRVSGTITNSNFVYSADKNFTGNLYFRIMRTDMAGKVFYSEIRSVYIDNSKKQKISIYPNPTVSGVNIQFADNSGSDYRVELFNSYGQLIFLKNYNITKAAAINIDWPRKPAPGTYFLKVTDVNHRTEQIQRLKIL
jgi:hypothetical protein